MKLPPSVGNFNSQTYFRSRLKEAEAWLPKVIQSAAGLQERSDRKQDKSRGRGGDCSGLLRLSRSSSGFKEGRAFGRGNSTRKVTDMVDLRVGRSTHPGTGKAPWGGGSVRWSWKMSHHLDEGATCRDWSMSGLECPRSLTSWRAGRWGTTQSSLRGAGTRQ